MLKSLEVTGFKSFARKSSFLFKAPVTAIVGPNGSGKSNVAEAFRFVLGEQSFKSMRGKRGEDLIWNGPADAGRVNRAAVRAVFDNSRKAFPVDFDEVVVERVVHRDGGNDYLVNGSPVRLKDVIELLAAAHIGATGHHIISQGEADRILAASPRERRAMVEDALGLKLYEIKREESARKLEKTAENMAQVESLRREVLPHLRFLEKQVAKVRAAEEDREKLVLLAKEYLKKEEVRITADRTKAAADKDDAERRVREAEAARAPVEEEHAPARDLTEWIERVRSARDTRDAARSAIASLEGELRSELRRLEEYARAGEGTVSKAAAKELVTEVRRILSRAELGDHADMRSAVADALVAVDRFEQSALGTGDDTAKASVHESVETLKRGLETARASLARADEELSSAEASLETARQESVKADVERGAAHAKAEAAGLALDAARRDLARAVGDLERLALRNAAFEREREECLRLAGRNVLEYRSLDITEEAALAESPEEQAQSLRAISRMKARLEEAGLSNAADVEREFAETSERDAFLARELADLTESRAHLEGLIAELGETLDTRFREGLASINTAFDSYFQTMFGGGSARLALERIVRADDSVEDDGKPQPAGLEIDVALPRKKVRGLMMLSGGERALTSIALLFAMSQVNPPPFIVLDETDAALDESNARKYGDMLQALSAHSQLIVITHNRETMSRAGVIYGVTMGPSGDSKILSVAFEEAQAVAKR